MTFWSWCEALRQFLNTFRSRIMHHHQTSLLHNSNSLTTFRLLLMTYCAELLNCVHSFGHSVVSRCFAWSHIRHSRFTASQSFVGQLNRAVVCQYKRRIELFFCRYEFLHSPIFLFFDILPFSLLRLLLFFVLSFVLHFFRCSFSIVNFASSPLAWRPTNSAITTKFRALVRAVVITDVNFATRLLFLLSGRSNNTVAGAMAGASLQCVSRIIFTIFPIVGLGTPARYRCRHRD